MFEKKSFHHYAENSVVYRHLRDYFNNPVKRRMISNGVIYAVTTPSGDILSHALTFCDMKLFRIYCLLLRDLRYCYDDEGPFPIAYFDRKFAPMVCEAAPHFAWRL